MNKKDFLTQVLQKLEPDWPPAGGLNVLIQQGEVDDQVMGSLITIIKDSIGDSMSKESAQKLQKGVHILEEIHAKENISRKADSDEIAQLEKQLSEL